MEENMQDKEQVIVQLELKFIHEAAINEINDQLFSKEDSPHKVYDFGVSGVQLHRFTNGGGIPYSAIYEAGCEIYSCEREEEASMLGFYLSKKFN